MPKHRIFDKGKSIYAIITSYNKPNVHLPVKCIIMDTKWDPVNPKYLVKIINFYDGYLFIRDNFFDMTFSKTLSERARSMRLKATDFNKCEDLINHFNGPNASRYYIAVDSLMCFARKFEMAERFSMLQLYMISKSLKQAQISTGRQLYKGPMKVDGISEYNTRMKRAWSDTFKNTGIDIDKYLDSIT